MGFNNSKLSSIPLIDSPAQLQQMMQVWRQALSRTVKVASAPPSPLNFRATNVKGGIVLTWGALTPATPNPVKILGEATSATGPDGYEILASKSGDFVSDLEVYTISDVSQTKFFYPAPTPTTVSFKIHSSAGNPYTPHSTFGPDSGSIRHTSLDTTDNTSKSTVVTDNATTDATRSGGRFGRYAHQYLSRTYASRQL